MDRMLVSIIIPLYNRQSLIRETIDTLRSQTYSNFECIIIDDHSTDESFRTARTYTDGDSRFIIKERTSKVKGAPSCRNEGMSMATGDYLMFLDSDDLLAEHCLEERINLARKNPKLDFIVTHIGIFKGDSSRVTHYWNSLEGNDDILNFLYANGWQTSSTFFKTEFVKQFRFDEEASSWQDIEFHMHILLTGPAYRKFTDNKPHVLIRRSDDRTGMKATNNEDFFKSISMRFMLMNKIESRMTSEQKNEYESHIRDFYLHYLEVFSVTNDSMSQLDTLYNYYKNSYAYRKSSFHSFLFRCYLKRQNSLMIKISRRVFRKMLSMRPLKSRAVPLQ